MKDKKRAVNTWIAPGQHSIDRVTAWRNDRGWQIKWSVRLPDGTLVRRRSQGKSRAAARDAAKRTAARLLAAAEEATPQAADTWQPDDKLIEFIATETIPLIRDAPPAELAESSKTRYLRVTKLLTNQFKNDSIADGCTYDHASRALRHIAKEHGPETAHQARTVLSMYVLDELVYRRVINANLLKGARIRLRGEHRGHGGKRDVQTALSREDYWRVVDYLLARENRAPGTNSGAGKRADGGAAPVLNARHSPAKWAAGRDMILLQAGTGLRVAEATSLRWDEVEDDGQTMIVYVSKARSKTKKARRAQVVAEVADHLRRRRAARPGDMYVISAPADGSKQWEPRARDRATSRLYVELADALGIELLRRDFRGHGWRHTLNTMTADSVPVEIRSALLGHSPKVNVATYLDLTDLTGVGRAISRKPDLKVVS